MRNSRLRLAGGLALLVVTVGVAGCSGGERPEVLGTQVTRPPDTTTTVPDGTTTSSSPPSDDATAATSTTRPTTATTVAAAPPSTAAATTTAPPTTVARGESFAPGPYDERSDSTAALERQPDGSWAATSSTQTENPPPPERLAFDVSLGLPSDSSVSVTVSLRNTSPRAISFPEGLRVLVRCTEDGAPWQDVVVEDRSVTGLQADQSVVRSSTVTVGEGRTYACAGEVRIVLV